MKRKSWRFHSLRACIDMVLASRRLSQAELAAEWRTTQSTISRWRAGERIPRRRDWRERFLALGVDPRCL